MKENKYLKFLLAGFSVALLAGCASKSDIRGLQSQVDTVKTDLASIHAKADLAKEMAIRADTAARKAEAGVWEIHGKVFRNTCKRPSSDKR